jgi:hypothetical protein
LLIVAHSHLVKSIKFDGLITDSKAQGLEMANVGSQSNTKAMDSMRSLTIKESFAQFKT